MLDHLCPVNVATAETRQDILDIELFAEEQRSLGRAVEKRRREFVTGRACARRALASLGIEATAIPSGDRGQPIWPPGVVGSITHCPGYRACALARRREVASLGIDAEVNAPLPPGVLREVAFGQELDLVAAGGPVHMDRLLFSAKEAIYKAWFPLAKRWLGFDDVELSVDIPNGTFRGRLLGPPPVLEEGPLTRFTGRWCLEDGIICTSVIICII